MNDTTRELGGALGVAVLGSVVATMFTSSLEPVLDELPPGARAEARAGLAGALGVARSLPGDAGPALADAARSACLDGLATAALTAAAVVAVTAVSAWRLLPHEHHRLGQGSRDESRRFSDQTDVASSTS
jgi:MFS transporter, DHA2 family, multidrug resistance protein